MKKTIITLLFLVASCSTITYVEPTEGPLTKVRFFSDTEDITVVRGYDDKNCNNEQEWMRLRAGILLNSTPKSLNIPLSEGMHKNAFKEFYVHPNIDFIYMFNGGKKIGRTAYSCGVPIKIKFNPNEIYELSYNYDWPNCSVDISTIKKDQDSQYKRKLIKKFKNKIGNFGENCMKAFKKTRLY
jgi:hypothetical protein